MVSDGTLKLIELVALALPAYALVLKTIADNPSHYPPQAVDGLAIAMGCVLVAGVILLGSMMTMLPTPVAVATSLIVASFIAVLHAIYHFYTGTGDPENEPG